MTLGEAKDKVYMLLDEHSAGGEIEHDEDIEKKMAFFFDIAQKELAKIKKIVKVKKIVPERGKTEYALPDDMISVYRVWRDERPATSRYRWKGGKIIIPERDAGCVIQVEYFALPETIPQDASDEYEFEIAEDAANAMPYYVAAQQLLPDLVMDYSGMLAMFNMAVQTLDTGIPGENGRMAQTFFRA